MRINFKRFFPCILAAALILVSAAGCAKSNSSVQENTTEAVIPDSLITIKDSDTDTDVSDAVEITLNGNSVSCSSSSVAINGSEITISSGGSYIINGTLDDGRIIVDADNAKVHLILNGVSIHSETNAAIYVKSADKTTITLADGTDNTLSDSSNYTYDDTDKEEPDAVLFSKDDLSINGNGSLNIEASFNNGITCKNDLKIISGTINVTAKNNAIKGKDSLSITGGTITASAEGKGLLSNNNEEEDKGYIHITGGTITLTCTDDTIHSNNAIYIEGGDMTLSSSDDGIHADNTLVISDGTIDITKCYEGLEAAAISIDGGAISITASDDGINAADSSSSSEGGPGMRGGPDMGENSGSNCSLTINGGTVYVNAGGDGIDSNSYIVMTGGALVVDGPTGNGNGGVAVAQSREHLGARPHGNTQLARTDELGVGLGNSGRDHDDVRLDLVDGGSLMAHMHLHAGAGKLANVARRLKVGAGNDIAALVKDEGDAAHAGATDTDKMGALELGRGGCSLGISHVLVYSLRKHCL